MSVLTGKLKREMEPFFRGYVESSERFCVEFDDVWRWTGYSTKGSAKRKLKLPGIQQEYLIHKTTENSHGGQNREIIKMSIDGFLTFCMIAYTPIGQEIRMYFLEVKKQCMCILRRAVDAEDESFW